METLPQFSQFILIKEPVWWIMSPFIVRAWLMIKSLHEEVTSGAVCSVPLTTGGIKEHQKRYWPRHETGVMDAACSLFSHCLQEGKRSTQVALSLSGELSTCLSLVANMDKCWG